MTGNEIDEIFGQQEIPQTQVFATINTLNYKMTDLVQLMERLLPAGLKRENAFKKLQDLKTAIDSAAIS